MEKVIILGAGGRDFHNFNTVFRDDPSYQVVAFTAAQIPFIGHRVYPAALAGSLYPEGIPIRPEEELEGIIREHKATVAVFSYSDISYEEVMHRASASLRLGADFLFPGPEKTMLRSVVPVLSVCAVRTGCGKSVITRKLALLFKARGIAVSVMRHPMAYCDFAPVRRFSTMGEIDRGSCTIEEREEFEHLVAKGITVYAGLDYRRVLDEAEKESRVILWDGGNNDFPFLAPDFEIVLLDALRPGHETLFYPGEVNLRRANLLIITKANEARDGDVERIRTSIRKYNPLAMTRETASVFTLDEPRGAAGKRVLVIEDGPTITHGGMAHGAGMSAAKEIAAEIVDPRPYAVGSIQETYHRFPHIGPVLPAIGYSESQKKDLEETIAKTPADVVVIATPVDLKRIVRIDKPVVRVSYDFDLDLNPFIDAFVEQHVR